MTQKTTQYQGEQEIDIENSFIPPICTEPGFMPVELNRECLIDPETTKRKVLVLQEMYLEKAKDVSSNDLLIARNKREIAYLKDQPLLPDNQREKLLLLEQNLVRLEQVKDDTRRDLKYFEDAILYFKKYI